MSQDAHLSLLSLSIAAASAAPISASPSSSQSVTTNTTKHRRLSSAGRSRRRLSDARDAATRPFPTSLQSASASLAALSLSSPMASHRHVHGAQPIQVPRATSAIEISEHEPASFDDAHLSASPPQSHNALAPNPVNGAKSGRKRGSIFTCESCSKVYRHPSCLIKHRWEHTPQWREASKFVLSKHQQVQLLEAAAILSHLSTSSASLPEDRSLWPSFLSGGIVPLPALASDDANAAAATSATVSTITPGTHPSFPISSSVPAGTILGSARPGSTGPRLHDYTIGGGGIGVTQVRPGVLGVPTAPMPVPPQTTAPTTREDDALTLLALRSASVTSGSWESRISASASASPVPLSSVLHSRSHSHSISYSHASSMAAAVSQDKERRRSNAYEYRLGAGGAGYGYERAAYAYAPTPNGGWSLPRSSLRSKSGSSESRSRSQSASDSRSDDEDEGDLDEPMVYGSRVRAWKTEETEISVREDEQEEEEAKSGVGRTTEQTWDGMEMEMEMD